MNKYYLILLGAFLQVISVNARQFKGEVKKAFLAQNSDHYEPELLHDVSFNEKAWDTENGLHAAFASTDKLYFRKEVPEKKECETGLQATVWKGERLNAQILVWSAGEQEQIRFYPEDLRSVTGGIIPKETLSFEMVRYVLSNFPYADKTAICGYAPYENGFLMPDRFDSFDRFDLPARTTRPVWMMMDIPGGTAPGTYTGKITIRSAQQSIQLTLTVRVQDQLLPQPANWEYRLDLWQNPWVIAWHNNVEPWSAEHEILLRQHLKLYADAGGKYISTYAVHSPWTDNSYWIEGGMIEWIRQRDGSWKFDYSIFDRYVSIAMDCGINKAITIYTPIPWANRFRVLDEQTGLYRYETWEPTTPRILRKLEYIPDGSADASGK